MTSAIQKCIHLKIDQNQIFDQIGHPMTPLSGDKTRDAKRASKYLGEPIGI